MNSKSPAQNQKSALAIADKLSLWSHCDGIVLAVSPTGCEFASVISRKLALPLEVAFCKSIEDPSDPSKTIGSVCVREAMTHERYHDLPQDYLARQIQQLRFDLKENAGMEYELDALVENKVVIIADDSIESIDEILATIRYLRRLNPLEIILAVAQIEESIVNKIEQAVDELFYLTTSHDSIVYTT